METFSLRQRKQIKFIWMQVEFSGQKLLQFKLFYLQNENKYICFPCKNNGSNHFHTRAHTQIAHAISLKCEGKTWITIVWKTIAMSPSLIQHMYKWHLFYFRFLHSFPVPEVSIHKSEVCRRPTTTMAHFFIIFQRVHYSFANRHTQQWVLILY